MTIERQADVIWDMETGDPDDFLTLIFLLGHPSVNLKAVTITPGTTEQVGLVRKALNWFDIDIPVGSYDIKHQRQCVSQWHYKIVGSITPSSKAEPAYQVLLELCDENVTLVTGAPLKNVGRAIAVATTDGIDFVVGRIVSQGGFAGEGVVPPEKQLDKFKGRVTCPTYNFNGDSKSAHAVLAYPGIREKYFVSKNVTHNVWYDRELHEFLGQSKGTSRSLNIIWKSMERYVSGRRTGKKIHDLLAACCAIDRSICDWREVVLFEENRQWGAYLKQGSNTWITVDYDRTKFSQILLATP